MTDQETLIVVMTDHYWGSGATLAEAKRNARKHGGTINAGSPYMVLTFGPGSTFAGVDELGRYHFEGAAPAVEMVNR